MLDKAILITFEGGDGTGKTTQVDLLSKWMKQRNIPHVVTKEPGSPHVAECIKYREILLNPKNEICNTSELLLFLADRAQHVEKFIRPTLESGMHVICDRFSDSSLIYQSVRGISITKVEALIDFATGGLKPDLTFVLDMPVKMALQRAKKNSKYEGGDRMENAGEKFHEGVRHGFLKLAESLSEQNRMHVVNVTPPKIKEDINKEIISFVSKALWIPKLGEE
jgi:dTMP kinase